MSYLKVYFCLNFLMTYNCVQIILIKQEHLKTYNRGDVRGAMVTVVNGHSILSLNTGRGCLHFTWC